MDDFLKLNEGVIDQYLERIYENFEVTSYDFKNGNPAIILDWSGYAITVISKGKEERN